LQVEARDLLLIGGQTNLEQNKDTKVLADTTSVLFHNKRWERKSLAKMKTPRISFAACFLGEDRQKVVVVGGYTQGRKALDLCELFDIHKNEWKPLPQMNSARVSSTVVNCPNKNGDDNLFVIGGAEENGALLDTIENLEPNSEDWVTLSFSLPAGGL
jgi:Galactose oxidase, central domain